MRLFVAPMTSLLVLIAAPWIVTPLHAQEANRAGLVIVHGDGSVVTRCVSFAQESISGYDLLAATGLDLKVEAAGMGATICALDGEGCGFPQEACFCQCQGSPCTYWSYWQLGEDGWHYRNLGAANTAVHNGDVEGWVWGEGTVSDARKPQPVSFAEICTAPQATGTPLAILAGNEKRAIEPMITPAPTTAAVQATPGFSPGLVGFVLVALVVMPVAAFAVMALWRRQQGGRS